ncbi:MAG: hypothetical protein HXS54_01555 [Theionarchaea archaeon]|nr:hypothetical protein [Theionarchaea archaeon]
MEFETVVQDIIQRTHNVKSFRFSKPESFVYKAGQFMFVTLKKEGEELRKHFTISSSPTEDFLEFTKKLSDSEYSQALTSLKVGDYAKINGPHGLFTCEGEFEKVGMLSGGIGITPLRSMLKYCTDKGLKTDIILLYCNRSQEDIAFREELERMEENQNIKVILAIDEAVPGWKGFVGRISPDMIKRGIPDYGERVFFLCGPPPMVDAMDALLTDLMVPAEHIKRENFYGY